VELVSFDTSPAHIRCAMRSRAGRMEHLCCQYLVGCDGAHSTVRKGAGIAFEGDAYLQDFMLGDVEADGEERSRLLPNTLHSFGGRQGVAMFFPLGRPTTWRVIAMSGESARARVKTASTDKPLEARLSLSELQAVVDGATGSAVHVRDPGWLTHFRLHHRQAVRYRRERIFLAGDAGHIHSPVGAQGMNTGIQHAWNLGWKLSLVTLGGADERLLDTYEEERWPVGQALLRYTDRIFTLLVRSLSASRLAAWMRRNVVARIVPLVLKSERVRALAFRFVSELGISYRKRTAVSEGSPRLRAGPRAGDRLPDAKVSEDHGESFLLDKVVGPCYHLLLCGPVTSWNRAQVAVIAEQYRDIVVVKHLTRQSAPNVLVDAVGIAFRRLGVAETAQYLIRPDGYVAFRCAGTDLSGLMRFLESWLVIREQRKLSSTGLGSDVSGAPVP